MRIHGTVRLLTLLLVLAFTSCGNNECMVVSMVVDPQTGVADHNAAPPGNELQFFSDGTFSSSCPAMPMGTPVRRGLQDVIWTVSDTTNVSISNVKDTTFGTSTCLGPTSGAATVTATLPADNNHGKGLVATGQITCN